MSVDVRHGDSRDVLKTLADCSIDAVVTDPPYALVSIMKRFGADNAAPAKGRLGTGHGPYARASSGFMGQKWDTGETAFAPDFWREVLRVLKPGGHLFACGGTRTYHRLACAIEDAGFEIREMHAWLFGSGFPKSHDVSKAIDKAAGAKRPVVGSVKRQRGGSDDVSQSGGRNYRLAGGEQPLTAAATEGAAEWEGWGTATKPAMEPICLARKPLSEKTIAANVLRWGTGALNIDASRIGSVGGCAGAGAGAGYEIFGNGLNGKRVEPVEGLGRWPANVCHDGSDEVTEAFPTLSGPGNLGGTRGDGLGYRGSSASRALPAARDDGGSAARFFYSAKADAEDRLGSGHPTVKPVDYMAWLCRLITPPGGTVLDPFAGTGTTGLAAMGAGFDCVLIEREAKYVADIERRLAWARGEGRLTAQESARPNVKPLKPMPLFGDDS